MHISQLHSANVNPDLKLYDASILVAREFKFLCLIFYKKLTFNKHVKYLKALNLLRVVAARIGERIVQQLKLYHSHVHSKFDYGCVMYGSARQSVLESLD